MIKLNKEYENSATTIANKTMIFDFLFMSASTALYSINTSSNNAKSDYYK